MVFVSLFPKNDKTKETPIKINQHNLLIRKGKLKKFSKTDTLNKHKIVIEIFVYLDSCFNFVIKYLLVFLITQ